MDKMIYNMQYLKEDVDPNILLLLGFCCLDHASHSEFEFPCCQDVALWLLSKVASPQSLTQISNPEAKIILSIIKDIQTNNLDQVFQSGNTILAIGKSHPKGPILDEDLNISHSDTSLDGGALPSPSKGVVTNPRRKKYVKGQG